MDTPQAQVETAVKVYEQSAIKGHKGFRKGLSGNPKGKPPGTKSFTTLFREACKTIAKDKGMNHKQVEAFLIMKGVEQALDGNFPFYKDTLDRLLGTATAQGNIKITQEIGENAAESLGELYTLINEHYKRQDSRTLREGTYKTLD